MRRRRLGRFRFSPPVSLSLLIVSSFDAISPPAALAQTFQVAWTTDVSYQGYSGIYGPDGPWQAIAVSVGNTTKATKPKPADHSTSGNFSGNFLANEHGDGPVIPTSSTGFVGDYTAMWPSGGGMSAVLTSQIPGGNYTPSQSSTRFDMGTMVGNGDDWMGYSAQRETSWGEAVYDIVTLADKTQVMMDDYTGSQFVTVNATMAALTEAEVFHPYENGSSNQIKYTPWVGTLGLGVISRGLSLGEAGREDEPVGMLRSLKQKGVIGYEGFGLHLGSVRHNQPGSLVLGGYERNRAVGEVGTFKFIVEDLPYMFLLDVVLGTQIGRSGFSGGREDEGSIWRVPSETTYPDGQVNTATYIRQSLGGKEGTAVVVPNPAVPYIYLPEGICEAAAERLPVVYNETLNLHFWDVDSPGYDKIMSSSSYMAFVLSDSSAKNLTIKVPFQLLNLTLETPLVDKPTPYFPCQTLRTELSYGFWTLGRAFLQAAFFGVDYERNVTYLAQAPGPAMGQRVVKAFTGSGEGIESNDIAEFESSWMGVWRVREEDQGAGPSISTGVIAGVVISGVAGLGILCCGIWMWLRRRERSSSQWFGRANGEKVGYEKGGELAGSSLEKIEMDTERAVAELGVSPAHEIDSSSVVHGASEVAKERFEMGSPGIAHEKEVTETVHELSSGKSECVELPAEVPIRFLPKVRKEQSDE